MMKIEYKKLGKGHEIYVNGSLVMWVIGSKKNAEKEIKEYLNANKN